MRHVTPPPLTPAHPGAGVLPPTQPAELPFTLKMVRTEDQLARICQLRSQAYGRHLPHMAAALREPEAVDREPGVVSFMAEDKVSGLVVGTMRVHLNAHRPLPIESVLTLSDELRGHLLVEVCRLAIRPGYNNQLVRLALFKALYLYSYAHQAQYMVVAARRPLNEIYKALGFKPADGGVDEHWIELPYAASVPHSMLKFDVVVAERTWYEMAHPLYQFMVRTFHPDIRVFSAVSPAWHTPRASDRAVMA